MKENGITKQSRYIKTDIEEKQIRRISIVFLFSLFVMPQYVGIPFPAFDLTILRIMMIIMFLIILSDDQRKSDFWYMVKNSKFGMIVVPFVMVTVYTMVFTGDLKSFLNPFMEFLLLYLSVYVIKYVLGMDRTIKCLVIFLYILSVMGIIEYMMGKSLFSYLVTIPKLYTGTFVRSGYYRIMGPTGHALAYGLLLIVSSPLACYDIREKKVDVLHRPVLILMLAINAFLTGSRSNLAFFLLEIFLLFLFSGKREKKKFIAVFFGVIICFVLFMMIFPQSSITQYFMLQVTTVLDEVLGTDLSVAYGADRSLLEGSTSYRELLVNLFDSKYVNPLLGYGRSGYSFTVDGVKIGSIDNFYVVIFVQYAYPGLLSFLLFIVYYVLHMLRDMINKKGVFSIVLFVGSVCYLINLYWVDSLLTLKYIYILFALYWCYAEEQQQVFDENGSAIRKSKYIRRYCAK